MLQQKSFLPSSGAGKSTLMDVISKRKTVGIVEGLILFDGHEPSHAEIGRDTGYVEQKDTLCSLWSMDKYCSQDRSWGLVSAPRSSSSIIG